MTTPRTLHPVLTRRRLLTGLAATAGAALLAACGETAANTAAPAAATAPPAATAAVAPTTAGATTGAAGTTAPAMAGRAVEIEVSHIFAGETHPMQLLINAFNAKNTGVTAKSRIDGTDYTVALQKAQASLAAGRPPAVVTTGWKYAPFAESALGIVSLDEVGGSEAKEIYARYPDNVLKIVNLKGKIVGLPFAFSSPVLYYNQDLFKEAGLDPMKPPATWDEAYAMGETLKGKGKQALGFNIDEWTAQSFVQGNGGNVLDDNGKVVFDSAETVGGYKVWLQSVQKGYFTAAKADEVRAAWTAGSVGMYVNSIASLGGFRAAVKAQFATAPFPTIGGKPRRMQSGGNFLGVYAKDRDQRRGAWEFLKFVSSEEGAQIWSKVGYMNATRWKVEVLPGQEAAYTHLAEGLTTETIWPGARGLEALKVYNDWLQKWVAAPTSVESTVQQAKTEVSALLS